MTTSTPLLLALLVVQSVQAEVFRVYGSPDGFPKYFEQDGEAKGIVVDITKHCLDDMQVPYQIKLMPWKRAYTMAERGEGGVIGLSISDERLALFDFSAPIFTEHVVLVVKKGREFPYLAITDLQDKLIGATIGTSAPRRAAPRVFSPRSSIGTATERTAAANTLAKYARSTYCLISVTPGPSGGEPSP